MDDNKSMAKFLKAKSIRERIIQLGTKLQECEREKEYIVNERIEGTRHNGNYIGGFICYKEIALRALNEQIELLELEIQALDKEFEDLMG